MNTANTLNWRCVFSVAALLSLSAFGTFQLPIYAQSSGSSVDVCTSGTVDYSNNIEQSVCLYGDDTGLDAYVYTEDDEYEDWGGGDFFVPAVGSDAQIYDGSTFIYDSGMNYGGTSITATGSVTPNINDWYTLNGIYSECYDPSGDGYSCNWDGGDWGWSVSAQVTPSVSVSSSNPTAITGTSVTFTASVNGGVTGTVTFYDWGAAIGTGSISGDAATLTTSSLATGGHAITASVSSLSSPTITQIMYVPGAIPIPAPGNIMTVAGNGTTSYSGDGSDALLAGLYYPTGVSVDVYGNIYIADHNNHRIRKVSAATGAITTVVGNGTAGFAGDGGLATSAELNYPESVSVDSSGNLYIADLDNNRIREVSAATGVITTIAGTSTAGFSGDGGPATSAKINQPYGIAIDTSGNVYFADYNNCRVRKISTSGTISTVAGNGTCGYSGDGVSATSAELYTPTDVALDGSGNLYIVDYQNSRIRKVNSVSGVITTVAGGAGVGFAGDGGAATSAKLYYPLGATVDPAGNIFIADGEQRIREVTASSGVINTIAGNGTGGYQGDGGPATSAEIGGAFLLSLDGAGNLYFPDVSGERIRVVGGAASPKSSVALIVSTSGSPSVGGSPVQFTAAVSTTGISPSGIVSFYSNGSFIGSGTFSGTAATFTTSSLSVGSNSITASWPGDSNYNPASSSPINQTVQPNLSPGQLSPSSGINPNDTYAVFDVAVQSAGGTYNYGTGSGPASLPAAVSFPHYHVEIGFDTSDNFVANITPTDPSGLTGFQAADFVSSIQLRGNTLTLLDGNGVPIQVQSPVPGAIIPGLIQAHVTASQSLNAALAPVSLSSFASAAGGSLTQNGSSAAVSIQNANGTSTLQYVTSGGNTTLASVTTTRTSQSFGSVTDTTTFSNMSAVTNPTGDARRAANAPAAAPNPSAPTAASTCVEPSSSYPVVGPGAGTNLTMVHGLLGSGGLTGSFHDMEPWIAGAMQVGPIALPDVGASNALGDGPGTQVSNLISQISGPSILIGHSQGGLVVRRFGQLEPNLTQGIITIDAPHQGALIAFTGIAGAISAIGYGLSYACTSPTHAEACALGIAIGLAGGFVTWDLALPNWPDLYPGSSFLNTLNNSADPAVTRVGIVSHSNPRFVELRVLGDFKCDPQEWCGGRALYTTGQVVYYSAIGSLVLDAAFAWLDPALVFDASISIDTILVMDGADLAWKVLTAAPGDTDGLVPGYSQTYPNASANYTIANADSHPGNLKSTYVRDTLEDVLAQQFAIPAMGCTYGLNTQLYASPASAHVPFYGGTDPIDAVAYGVSNTNLCPIQGVSSVPFAQTGPLAVGSLQYNYGVDFNFSNQPRYGDWWNIEGQYAGAYQDPLPKPVALGSLTITGNEQLSAPLHQNGDIWQVYDYGTVTLTINNVAYSVPYGPYNPSGSGCFYGVPCFMPTPASIMTALVSQINAGPQYVNAGFANCAITIAAWNPTATTTDYNMSINIQSSLPDNAGPGGGYDPAFPNPSFYGVLSGPTLTGNP